MIEKDDDLTYEINTNSNQITNKNKNLSLKTNTYISTINEKSTIDDNLLNNDILLPNSNNTNYIQSSIPENKIDQINEINDANEINYQNQERSLIDILNEKVQKQLDINIQGCSIIPVNALKDYAISPDCHLGLSQAPSSLLSDIMKINANNVLSPLLNIRKNCFRKMNVEEIMSWQKKEISTPLLKMEQEYDKRTSVQMFRNLLSYMTDRVSSKKPLSHATKFIKMVKVSNPIIKDEAYLQVYKQLHNNRRRESLMRGWKMMAIISSCFVPNNKDIYYLILNYLFFELQNSKDEPIQKHINYIFAHMIKTEKKERNNMPCSEELEYIELLKSMPVPIYFFNGKQTIVKVEPYTTFKDIKSNIMEMLDFSTQRAIFYSIYEICYKKDGTEERFIDDNETIGDVLSLWKSDIEKGKNKNEVVLFRFYLKLLIYYPYDESNIDNISIEYYQTLYDVISGKFSLEESQILILAALQLSIEFGPDMEKAYIALKENYESYIPGNRISLMSKDQYIEKIIELYSMFSFYLKNECKMEYIKILEKNITFHTQQFGSKFHENKSTDNEDNIPENCILGFQPEGIIILNTNREKVVFYEYVTIKNWGISMSFFVITISLDNLKLRRLYFSTGETNVIQTIMEIYGCFIAGISFKDIQTIIEDRDKKFINNTQTKRIATKYSRDADYDYLEKTHSHSIVFPILPGDKEDD